MNNEIIQQLNNIAKLCYESSRKAGWWNDLVTGKELPRNLSTFCEKGILIHSEISEALEGIRKDLMDDKLPNRKMVEVEIADALIRIFDLCGAYGFDIGGALAEKFNYNQTRADHKIENRLKEGGKRI